MCSVRQAQGKQNTSVFTLATILNSFLLQHPTHHTLIILTDFPWASMHLDAKTDFINMLVSITGNICTHHHTHPSFRPCKFVCPNLYQDCSDIGQLVDKEALKWTREKFEATQHLLGSMEPPAGRDSLEESFDNNNMPTSEFLRRVRSFAGDLIYRHFRGT